MWERGKRPVGWSARPDFGVAADAHNHHLTDENIKGGTFRQVNGAIALPKGRGLGVEFDPEKAPKWAEHFRRHGGYAYDRDPVRAEWYRGLPRRNFADPAKGVMSMQGGRTPLPSQAFGLSGAEGLSMRSRTMLIGSRAFGASRARA